MELELDCWVLEEAHTELVVLHKMEESCHTLHILHILHIPHILLVLHKRVEVEVVEEVLHSLVEVVPHNQAVPLHILAVVLHQPLLNRSSLLQ